MRIYKDAQRIRRAVSAICEQKRLGVSGGAKPEWPAAGAAGGQVEGPGAEDAPCDWISQMMAAGMSDAEVFNEVNL